MNKTRFVEELIPWIKERMDLEGQYHIESFISSKDRILNDNLCNQCGEVHTLQDPTTCKLILNNISTKTNDKKRRLRKSLSQDILIKSALSAVAESSEEQQSWYDDTDLKEDSLNDIRSRLARMHDLSRSESSLFQETANLKVEMKEVLSDQDTIQSQERNERDNTFVSQTDLVDGVNVSQEHQLPLPRSSSRVQRRMGHSRSKSDQIGVIRQSVSSNMGGSKATLTHMSTSLPKEITQSGNGSIYWKTFLLKFVSHLLIVYVVNRTLWKQVHCQIYNHFHNILRLFGVLKIFPFTTSETMRDYYLQTWHVRVAKRLMTWDVRKLGNIRRVSKPHRMIS